MALLFGQDRNVTIKLRLIERPYQLLGGLCDLNLGSDRLAEVSEPLCQPQELVRNHRALRHNYLAFLRLFRAVAGLRTRAAAGFLSKVSTWSSLASISSSFISTLVRRSARLRKSARDGMLNCCSACTIDFSRASRKGAEAVR